VDLEVLLVPVDLVHPVDLVGLEVLVYLEYHSSPVVQVDQESVDLGNIVHTHGLMINH
jgi:hypothetical protein